jgi:hypothetical protein
MSRWFRCYDDLVDDPKVQQLPAEQFKGLINLWCLASQNDGMLPAADDIAFKLRMKAAKVEHLLSVLGECGLIDSDETGLRPHNWNGRQFKSDVSNERVKQHRERKRNVTPTVTATPPETEQIQNRKEDAAVAASDPETDLFRRGKEVLGKAAGGMIKQLLTAKGGKINSARAAIETAAGKENPREYIGGILRNQDASGEVSRFVDGRL